MTEADAVFYARAAMVLIPVGVVALAAVIFSVVTGRREGNAP